jgi:hypothetical protein
MLPLPGLMTTTKATLGERGGGPLVFGGYGRLQLQD